MEKNISVPNVVGMEINKAIYEMQKLGLYVEVEGEGDIVVSQTPPSEILVCKNSIIILST